MTYARGKVNNMYESKNLTLLESMASHPCRDFHLSNTPSQKYTWKHILLLNYEESLDVNYNLLFIQKVM